MRQNTSINCARSRKRSTNCKRRFRSRSIHGWRISPQRHSFEKLSNLSNRCSGVTQTIFVCKSPEIAEAARKRGPRISRKRRAAEVTQASSPPQDGFAVVNLTRPAAFPVRQPDGLVLWRACSSATGQPPSQRYGAYPSDARVTILRRRRLCPSPCAHAIPPAYRALSYRRP